eukprot:365462-Chlamydomonas_euryale.AAC.11
MCRAGTVEARRLHLPRHTHVLSGHQQNDFGNNLRCLAATPQSAALRLVSIGKRTRQGASCSALPLCRKALHCAYRALAQGHARQASCSATSPQSAASVLWSLSSGTSPLSRACDTCALQHNSKARAQRAYDDF